MSDTVAEHCAKRAAAARDAMARGQAALAAGDVVGAARWLDRARRVAGGNDAIGLLLASVLLRLGDPAAAPLFESLARRHDLREAWLGLAQARLRFGDAPGAAAALNEALAAHFGAPPESLWPLADAIAAAVEAPGWCCLTEDGEQAHPPQAAGAAGLIGLPFQHARMQRIEGFVDVTSGALTGWAWHPNHASASPALSLVAADGATCPITVQGSGAALLSDSGPHDRPLAQPRAFQSAIFSAGPVRIVDGAGRDLPGSPVDPGAFGRYVTAVTDAAAGRAALPEALRSAPIPADFIGPFRPPPPRDPAPLAVVVPVYRNRAATIACLTSVIAHSPAGARLIVVDDASPEPDLSAALDRLHQAGQIELVRHDRNRGFPAAANTGMRAAPDADVVLLNADTLVPKTWLERLRAAAYAAADIGTATPFSNDATLLSYPAQTGGNPIPTQAEVGRLDRLAARANAGRTIDIPTAVGFCMYIRRACLDQVGLLREDVFAQGYGEENDFCLRARHLGWRHVAATGLFVGHVGGVSFGAARAHLLARNLATLNRLHPGYDALIAADAAGPALAAARRRMDLATLPSRRAGQPSVALITHDLGGGVERQVQSRCAELRAKGFTPVILRPVYNLPFLQGTGQCKVEINPAVPNLIYDTATELPALAKLLAGQGVGALELHHMIGHDHALLSLATRLNIPYDIHLHDYAWFCPRVTLVSGDRRYCGEPDIAGCQACIDDNGSNTDEDISPADLVARSARELAAAARIVAPSADVATRIARHFPGLAADIMPWDDTRPPPPRRLTPPTAGKPRRVAILGAIGVEKGYDILLACARDAAARALPLRFTVLGHTTDDARLLRTGVVFITGEYTPADLPALITREQVDLAFVPSIWPETWCFTLSEAWRAGLHVVAFDIGAPAERIRRHGGGRLLPLACPAPQINAALIA